MVLSRRKRPILTAVHLDAILRGNLNSSNHLADYFSALRPCFPFPGLAFHHVDIISVRAYYKGY
jgi:hypothetical protein